MAVNRKNILTNCPEGLYRDKGSRFLAYAWPVDTEEAIREKLEWLRKEHVGARHWCYAWRLGEQGEKFRSNDDGEPSGSAGRPILAAIDQHSLSDCLVVVVRYFGGTLLGVRGLIDAYGAAALDALEKGSYRPMPIPRSLTVRFPYDRMALVQKVLNETGIKPTATAYSDTDIHMDFREDTTQIELLHHKFESLYGLELFPDADTGS